MPDHPNMLVDARQWPFLAADVRFVLHLVVLSGAMPQCLACPVRRRQDICDDDSNGRSMIA
jgi:hypothetical protein